VGREFLTNGRLCGAGSRGWRGWGQAEMLPVEHRRSMVRLEWGPGKGRELSEPRASSSCRLDGRGKPQSDGAAKIARLPDVRHRHHACNHARTAGIDYAVQRLRNKPRYGQVRPIRALCPVAPRQNGVSLRHKVRQKISLRPNKFVSISQRQYIQNPDSRTSTDVPGMAVFEEWGQNIM